MIENYLSGEAGIGLISGALFALGIMLLMVEAVSPGVGAGGFLGAACQLACFAPDVLVGSAPVSVFLLAAGGCALLMLDSNFVGVGPLGWVGVGLLLGALGQAALDAMQFIYTLCASAVFTGAALPVALARLPKSRMMAKIELNETLEGSGAAQKTLPEAGAEGVVLNALKPRGMVRIGEERYEASAAIFIEKGALVRVVRSEGGALFVERVKRAQEE